MPYINEVLEDGRVCIVVTHLSGHLTREMFAEWNRSYNTLATQYDFTSIARMYSIVVVPPGTTAGFGAILEQVRAVPNEAVIPNNDPAALRLLFVSDQPIVKLAAQLARGFSFFGQQGIPIFRTLEDALAHIAIDRQTLDLDNPQG